MKLSLLKRTRPLALLIAASLLFSNCATEDSTLTEGSRTESSNEIKSRLINLNELRQMPKVMEKLDAIRQTAPASNMRTVSSSTYKFSIDTEKVLLIEKDDYQSLTFPVVRDNANGYLENLFLHPHNGKYLAFLFRYDVTSTELTALENGTATAAMFSEFEFMPLDDLDIGGDINVSVTSGGDDYGGTYFWDDGVCYTVLTGTNPEGYLTWTYIPCPNCPCPEDTIPIFQVAPYFAFWNIGAGGGGNGGNNGNGGSTGGGGNGYNPFNPPKGTDSHGNFTTNPNLPGLYNGNPILGIVSPNHNSLSLFVRGLSDEQKDYLNDTNNADVVWAIYNFIDGNHYSFESIQIAKEMINALISGGDVDVTYQIILDATFVENTTLMDIYTDLGAAPTFQNYLQNFDGDFSVANLKLSVGDTPGAMALTFPPVNFLVEIKFDNDYLNRPALAIVGTFVHELIHAEVFRKLMMAAKNGSLNYPSWPAGQFSAYLETLRNDFPGLYDYYTRYEYSVPLDGVLADADHQMMAQHYRGIIIDVLKEYDNTQPEEVYEAISWIGLMGTGEIDMNTGLTTNPTVAWQNLSQAQRIQIVNTYFNFIGE